MSTLEAQISAVEEAISIRDAEIRTARMNRNAQIPGSACFTVCQEDVAMLSKDLAQLRQEKSRLRDGESDLLRLKNPDAFTAPPQDLGPSSPTEKPWTQIQEEVEYLAEIFAKKYTPPSTIVKGDIEVGVPYIVDDETHQKRPLSVLKDLGKKKVAPEFKSEWLQPQSEIEKSSFIYGVSGCGKTRFCLETLCQYWGFYIVSQVKEFGSEDATQVRHYLDARFMNQEPDRGVAIRCYQHILLARCMLLEFLSRNKSFTNLEWLLMQLFPLTQTRKDIFTEIIYILQHTGKFEVTRIIKYYKDLLQRRHNQNLLLFYDEAQIDARELSAGKGYQSSQRGQPARPLLAIVNDAFAKFSGVLSFFSGSSLSIRKAVTEILYTGIGASSIGEIRTHTNFKAILKIEDLVELVKWYGAEDKLEPDEINRIFLRLQGRCRFSNRFFENLCLRQMSVDEAIREVENKITEIILSDLNSLVDVTPIAQKRLSDVDNVSIVQLIEKIVENDFLGSETIYNDRKTHCLVDMGFAMLTEYDYKECKVEFFEPLALRAAYEFSRNRDSALNRNQRKDV